MRPSCLRVPMDDGVQVASKGRMRCAHRPSSMTLARTLSPPRPIHVWMRWRKKRWSTTKTRCDRKKKMESSVGRIRVRRSPAVTEGARCGLVWSPHLPLSRLALCSASSLPACAPRLELSVASEIDNNFMISSLQPPVPVTPTPTGARLICDNMDMDGPSVVDGMGRRGRTEVTVCASHLWHMHGPCAPVLSKNVMELGI